MVDREAWQPALSEVGGVFLPLLAVPARRDEHHGQRRWQHRHHAPGLQHLKVRCAEKWRDPLQVQDHGANPGRHHAHDHLATEFRERAEIHRPAGRHQQEFADSFGSLLEHSHLLPNDLGRASVHRLFFPCAGFTKPGPTTLLPSVRLKGGVSRQRFVGEA